MIAPPTKTELGQDELRKRTRKLSQRHRTVLLLVDGKRSRLEVIELAQKAGVAPSFFEELLALGMVDEPSVPTAPAPLLEPSLAPEPAVSEAAAEAVAVEAAATDDEAVTAERVEIDIAAPVTDAPLIEEPEELPVAEPAAPAAVEEPQVERRVADVPPLVERRKARAQVKFSTPAYAPPAQVRESGPVPLVSVASAPPAPRQTVPQRAAASAEPPLDPEQRLLSEVRSLLVNTLLLDGPVTSSLIALRVGRARSREELIALVWEIEHSLARSRRPREARGRLERARDLLGLGNTLVDEDTSFGRDSKW